MEIVLFGVFFASHRFISMWMPMNYDHLLTRLNVSGCNDDNFLSSHKRIYVTKIIHRAKVLNHFLCYALFSKNTNSRIDFCNFHGWLHLIYVSDLIIFLFLSHPRSLLLRVFNKVKSRSAHMKSHRPQESDQQPQQCPSWTLVTEE